MGWMNGIDSGDSWFLGVGRPSRQILVIAQDDKMFMIDYRYQGTLAPMGILTPEIPSDASLSNHTMVSETWSGSSNVMPRLAISATASSSSLYHAKDIPVFVAPKTR